MQTLYDEQREIKTNLINNSRLRWALTLLKNIRHTYKHKWIIQRIKRDYSQEKSARDIWTRQLIFSFFFLLDIYNLQLLLLLLIRVSTSTKFSYEQQESVLLFQWVSQDSRVNCVFEKTVFHSRTKLWIFMSSLEIYMEPIVQSLV